MKIKIVIAEDIARLAKMLEQKLALDPRFEVKATVPNGSKLIQHLQKDHVVDVVLMDINMPVMDGITATEKVRTRWPHIKVIMSTVFDDEKHIFDAILAGANGYLLKDERPADIHRAITEVLEGGAPMNPAIARKALELLRRPPETTPKPAEEDFKLTPREKEILEHLASGLSYDQIASNLHISNGTVRKHVENTYRKLQVHNKVEAIRVAERNRLI